MFRMLLTIACLLLAGPALAGDLQTLDSDNGFGGAQLGSSLATFAGLELVSTHGAGGTHVYVTPAGEARLGSARLDDVTLGFYRGRLYFVALFTNGRSDTRAALAALQSAYGPGTRVPGEAREYIWHGERVMLHFREDPVTELGMVGFTSRSLDSELKRGLESVPADLER